MEGKGWRERVNGTLMAKREWKRGERGKERGERAKERDKQKKVCVSNGGTQREREKKSERVTERERERERALLTFVSTFSHGSASAGAAIHISEDTRVRQGKHNLEPKQKQGQSLIR